MIKKILYILIVLSNLTYSSTNFNFSNHLVVLYKVLDPLSVTVDTPEKMRVRPGTQTFLYSEVVNSRAPLSVRVQAPYNIRDEILDRIYGTATLELQNMGRFEFIETTNPTQKVEARGFFPSEGESSSKMTLPLYSGSTPANRYDASTTIDIRLNETQQEMLMGVYKGVLLLDVTYGE